MRKLLLLALAGGAAAYFLKGRDEQAAPSAASAGGGGFEPTPADQHAEEVAAAEATPEEAAVAEPASTADTVESDAIDPGARFDQTEHAPHGDNVVPDTSDDDPLVRQQEAAAGAAAGTIGGEADTVTADVEPEMRPVVEGSGDAEETFEATEDEGR
jgi:hypothetical protein